MKPWDSDLQNRPPIGRCVLPADITVPVDSALRASRLTPSSLNANDLGYIYRERAYLRVKRALDLLAALVLLPAAIPILLIASLAIRIESPGSPFFVQRREGWRGKAFRCIKLRTMRSDSGGPPYTLFGDERITRVGHVLRKCHVDELPQILNVIAGQMSRIGPRPESCELAHEYARQIPSYELRRVVRPGISGWAAVHQGNVGSVEAAREKLEYDIYYVHHLSIGLDLLITLKTMQIIAIGLNK